MRFARRRTASSITISRRNRSLGRRLSLLVAREALERQLCGCWRVKARGWWLDIARIATGRAGSLIPLRRSSAANWRLWKATWARRIFAGNLSKPLRALGIQSPEQRFFLVFRRALLS